MTEKFMIERRLEIDAAHRVPDHASKCFALHGHRYVVLAGCEGDLQPAGEQKGMVMDFGFLKELMVQEIYNPCDHGTIVYRNDVRLLRQLGHDSEVLADRPWIEIRKDWQKLYIMNTVPTAENLARHWYYRVQLAIGKFFEMRIGQGEAAPSLAYVKVYETPNCFAEYRPTVAPHRVSVNIDARTGLAKDADSKMLDGYQGLPAAHFPPFNIKDGENPGGTD